MIKPIFETLQSVKTNYLNSPSVFSPNSELITAEAVCLASFLTRHPSAFIKRQVTCGLSTRMTPNTVHHLGIHRLTIDDSCCLISGSVFRGAVINSNWHKHAAVVRWKSEGSYIIKTVAESYVSYFVLLVFIVVIRKRLHCWNILKCKLQIFFGLLLVLVSRLYNAPTLFCARWQL
jgi:hypothetical protein